MGLILIVIFIAIVAVGGYFVFVKNPEPVAQQLPSLTTDTPSAPAVSQNLTTQSQTETPVAEENIASQPAYLLAAYSKNGKNYIDVDYVEWLHDEASVKAQVEDGQCANFEDCYAYPNGYKRNKNPKIRALEVSPSAPIEVNGTIAFIINEMDQVYLIDPMLEDPFGKNLLISFEKFEDAVLKIKSSPSYEGPPAFITIVVKDNIVTKIIEPYQE